jgi:hypothetical protein
MEARSLTSTSRYAWVERSDVLSMVTIIDVPVSRIIDGKFIGAKRGPRESVVSRFRFPIPL